MPAGDRVGVRQRITTKLAANEQLAGHGQVGSGGSHGSAVFYPAVQKDVFLGVPGAPLDSAMDILTFMGIGSARDADDPAPLGGMIQKGVADFRTVDS